MSATRDNVEATAPTTEVTIYGRTYRLRGAEGSDHLRQLAELVDEKMREVAEATGTADTLKLAILACLNLADDYVRVGGRSVGSDEVERRLTRLVDRLDEVLEV